MSKLQITKEREAEEITALKLAISIGQIKSIVCVSDMEIGTRGDSFIAFEAVMSIMVAALYSLKKRGDISDESMLVLIPESYKVESVSRPDELVINLTRSGKYNNFKPVTSKLWGSMVEPLFPIVYRPASVAHPGPGVGATITKDPKDRRFLSG
jgi:hypothetical protein